MGTIGNRLKEERDRLGMNQTRFAEAGLTTRKSQFHYETGSRHPDSEYLSAIAKIGADVLYILTGQRASSSSLTPEGKYPPLTPSPALAAGECAAPPYAADFVYVPRYEVAASAGHGTVVTDESIVDYLAFKQRWITTEMRLDPRHLALITVNGDSMQGTLGEGDLILLDTRPLQHMKPGIYVIRLNGDLLVKRLARKVNGDVDVVSDNKHYKTETLPADQASNLEIVGKVVWQGRKI